MKKNDNALRGGNVWLFILVIAAAIALIFWLKSSASKPEAEQAGEAGSNRAALPVATPDTSVAPGTLPAVPDSVAIAPADDIGHDRRPADEAGEEDGYWDGYYDGIAGQENKPHDISPAYNTRSQRETYRSSYATGYARGYDEGSHAS